jgi:dihydrofolate reductase
VATSLDGYIATRDGGYDWIVADESIDFGALIAQFDTLVMGRKTYEVLRGQGPGHPYSGLRLVVASRTLAPSDAPDVTILPSGIIDGVRALKAEPGRDVWLFGGGDLFRQLLDAGLVDTVEIALMPVLLGDGIPVLPPGPAAPRLVLERSSTLPSGIVMLTYAVAPRDIPPPPA